MGKEYIEREAAIKRFTFATLDCLGMEPMIGSADVVAALKSIPATDVVPVRHGKWVGHDIGGRMSIDNDACSECGSVFYQIAETGCVWHYCPNCGARMDGDGE